MAERWAVSMVEALRGQHQTADSGGDGLMLAKISSAHPVKLQAHDQIISRYLYVNPSLSLQAGDEVVVLKSGVSFYILVKVVPA